VRYFAPLLLLCAGCGSLATSLQSAEGMEPEALRRLAARSLQAAVVAYNDGRIQLARELLESILDCTGASDLARIKAAAHFYLGAVEWDLGNRERTEFHISVCRRIDPAYEPDWVFISPVLRRYFESLK
jgi:hypothetical protein